MDLLWSHQDLLIRVLCSSRSEGPTSESPGTPPQVGQTFDTVNCLAKREQRRHALRSEHVYSEGSITDSIWSFSLQSALRLESLRVFVAAVLINRQPDLEGTQTPWQRSCLKKH